MMVWSFLISPASLHSPHPALKVLSRSASHIFHHSILAIARQRWRWSLEWNIHDCSLELCILQTLAWHPAQSPSRHEVGGGASTGGRHALEEAGFLVLQCLLPW